MPAHLPAQRIAVIDGLRGVAIISVLCFHISLFAIAPGDSPWERMFHGFTHLGWAGVDLFFVLSGFLITGILAKTLQREDYYRSFYFRRTVRIFPLYYLSLAIFFCLVPAAFSLWHRAGEIPAFTKPPSQAFAWFYLLNWRIGLCSFLSVPGGLSHLWSLSIEEQFYFVWPFVMRMLTPRKLVATCAALLVTSLASRVVLFKLHLPDAAYAWTFCRFDSLAVGAVLALCFRDRRHWRVVSKVALPVTVIALGTVAVLCSLQRSVSYADVWMGTGGITAWSIFFGGLLVIALNAGESNIVSRILSSPSLRFCGRYSYCMYVCHQPLILALVRVGVNSANLTRILGSKILAVLSIYVVVFALVILISLTSWRLFEKHFLKLKELFPVGVPQGWPARTSSQVASVENVQPEFAGAGLVRERDNAPLRMVAGRWR